MAMSFLWCVFRHNIEIKHTGMVNILYQYSQTKILSNYKELNYNIPRTRNQNKNSVNETITHYA
ncbi:hypothetical protein YYE_02710 [Plasmodium vinckei vinckei]|nr:hypothetical protein YYE_02710 [Plasmodium vinckei vinckei]